MKKIIQLLSVTLLLLTTFITKAQNKVDWKEKTEFHTVMSETFHPLEEGNYAPIKARSKELLDKAIAWKKSGIPSDFKQVKGIKTSLKKLVAGAKSLHQQVSNKGSEDVIKKELTALHDVFHTIVGLCKSEAH